MHSVQASSALVAEQKTGGPRAKYSEFSWLELPKATQLLWWVQIQATF